MQDLLFPLMLRRFKNQERSGKRLLDLPKKHVHLIRLQFSSAEADFYRSLYDRTKTEFDTFVQKGTLMHYTAIVALLTKVRIPLPNINVDYIGDSKIKRNSFLESQ
jgi:SNF2 family DNA or RNA helicase